MQMAKSVEDYLDTNSESKDVLVKLRSILLRTELVEELKWGIPYYTLNKKHVVGLAAFKTYTGLWFTNGVFLEDYEKVLINAGEDKTKGLRQWRFENIHDIDPDLVHAYIVEAIDNQKAGKEIKVEAKPLVIPEELDSELLTNIDLKLAFKSLTRGKQVEYANYIGEAKQDATRINRLRKSIPMMLEGKGLNDRYR
jgi:uncharacterized protein YdeI (YjbR/CyaY-like superfamily)